MEKFDLSISSPLASPVLSKMGAAMDYVIEMGNVPSVGGYKVQVSYDKKFTFTYYNRLYRGYFQLPATRSHILGHGDAQEGAYSVHFFYGATDHKSVALHVRQAELGIVYHRHDAGLLRPTLYKFDEVDFIDNILKNLNIPITIVTQDRAAKHYKDGVAKFDKKDYTGALASFLKGLHAAKDKDKAMFLFHLGVVQWNLKDYATALKSFDEAIKVEPKYKTIVEKTIATARRNKQS